MSDPKPKHTATMVIPKGAKKVWTSYMYGDKPVPEEVTAGTPIVMATARFDDGNWVVGGVCKSEDTSEYNNWIFFWVFDKHDRQYPGWPIDVGDVEDFDLNGITFLLNDDEDDVYLLNIVEAGSLHPHASKS